MTFANFDQLNLALVLSVSSFSHKQKLEQKNFKILTFLKLWEF